MAIRYELPDATRDLVADIFGDPGQSGRPRADDQLMLNGVLWVLCLSCLARHAQALLPIVATNCRRPSAWSPQASASAWCRASAAPRRHRLRAAAGGAQATLPIIISSVSATLDYCLALVDELSRARQR